MIVSNGKGMSLIKLREVGFNVPFFIILKQNECVSANLQKVANDKFPEVNLFAVRSSFVGEDGQNKSFAGHFYSAIAVTRGNLEDECKKVISSYKGGEGDVILQEFINSDRAGVVFSNAGDNKIIINSILGLCEPVVRGKLCDEYIIDRTNNHVISKKIEMQKEAMRFKDNKFINYKTDDESLVDKQIKEIIETSLEIEKLFNLPQDIEFCFYENKLFILQSRPITKSVFSDGVWVYYDNANIAESYSGIVLPLTFSFVKLVYSKVYQDLLCASGVSRKKVEMHHDIFDSLIASFYGKFYYNMNSWYKMMAFLPGYKRNKKNLELMISSNVKTEIVRDIKPRAVFYLIYPLIIIWKLLTFPITISNFKKRIKKILDKYSKTPIEKMTFGECKTVFQELLFSPLKKWYITVENDTALMTLLGRMHLKDKEVFDTMRITSHTVSANQVSELKKLADQLMRDKSICIAINNKDKDQFNRALLNNLETANLYDKYFITYGGRFANELKLESNDLRDDFEKFSLLIKMYSQTNFTIPTVKIKNKKIELLSLWISFFATNREETRLLRSNMFSVIRRIFLRMGVILYENGYITNSSDIFYLSIDEILKHTSKEKSDLVEIVNVRKKEYSNYISMNLPSHFSLKKGEFPKVEIESEPNNKILRGSTSSPGCVSGKVRVFTEFIMPDQIDFDILVAKHTDPGWVPLIALCKGLIIEYGGVLSHASIVSRELGIPTIVGVNDATKILKTGDMVELNGKLGVINIK